jgi:hypothetical protein
MGAFGQQLGLFRRPCNRSLFSTYDRLGAFFGQLRACRSVW